ncbi:hypothetical protein J4Q44_G00338410 [Coregonus suidteri]|uniref:Uncharacterized protein n=1 Tax=Coregonus suidteri TaxID=861788 RepID=A0AAN8KR83_9TELE
MDFDALLRDLQGLLGTHLHWKSPEVAAVVSVVNGVEAAVLEGCCEVVPVPSCPGTPHRTRALADSPPEPPDPQEPQEPQEAGDGGTQLCLLAGGTAAIRSATCCPRPTHHLPAHRQRSHCGDLLDAAHGRGGGDL